jgi:hypothetical protein
MEWESFPEMLGSIYPETRRQSHETCIFIIPLLWPQISCLYYKKVKSSRYRPGVAQRVGGGIALHFHDRGTRRAWVVSSTPRPHFTPGQDLVRILQEAFWAPGSVWTDGKSPSQRDLIPNRPARSSVAIPTELPGPRVYIITRFNTKTSLESKCFLDLVVVIFVTIRYGGYAVVQLVEALLYQSEGCWFNSRWDLSFLT